MEEAPAARRVCDEAYLQLRRLLNPRESVERYHLNASAFLQLSTEEKENEIRKARKSRMFSELSGMDDESP